MNVDINKVFGELRYETSFERDYSLIFLGETRSVTLIVDGDEDVDFEKSQYEAFIEFEEIKEQLIKEVESKLFDFYQSECAEKREQYGTDADSYSPLITTPTELEGLLTLTGIIVMESFGEEERRMDFLFEATWEPEHGISVKCINGRVAEIGFQDIVL